MAKYYSTTLQKGSQGDEVKKWQEFLNTQGYGLSVDGDFGNNTYNATIAYQKANGLTTDGIVGKNTWGKAGYKSYSDLTTPTAAPNINTTSTAIPTINALPNNPSYDSTNYDETEKGKNALTGYENAKEAVNSFENVTYDDYVKGESVLAAENALNAHIANKPGEYQSQWQSQLDNLMNSIMNRDKFSYDLNGDALYQQYKDKYIQQGKLAMGDAIGQASAMTGGYGNSYAQSVGQQQYQAQLNNLNDIVPELYQMALDKYKMEGQDLYNQYGLLMDRENSDYGRYRDTVSDFLTERDYLTGRVDSETSFDYGKYMDDKNFKHTLNQEEYARLLDALGIAQSDYYDGANMFYNEQSNKNSLLGQQFSDEMNLWNADTNQKWTEWEASESARKEANDEAWKQAEWDESMRQSELGQYWTEKEFDANQDYVAWQKSQASKNSGNSGGDTGDGGNDNPPVDDETPETYASWGAADWESYFANIRNTEGKEAAEEELDRMNKKGLIPKNKVTYAAIGARGSLGH